MYKTRDFGLVHKEIRFILTKVFWALKTCGLWFAGQLMVVSPVVWACTHCLLQADALMYFP